MAKEDNRQIHITILFTFFINFPPLLHYYKVTLVDATYGGQNSTPVLVKVAQNPIASYNTVVESTHIAQAGALLLHQHPDNYKRRSFPDVRRLRFLLFREENRRR
ncbi:hypothetical protein AMQ84_27815 [Paenibacillus riograndensis]|uniref:Uncharacterized protein n=1 Tax=Paenibacillus riograndensis TaxID=483937 RepID=A0A132TK43_9BACL|nr:hypothetical protein AMQ84_27815 [Paenibacillus riograndensis]KWX84717.1 hypothetical protein AMQ83_29055 [Paenibacillus riograndensis]